VEVRKAATTGMRFMGIEIDAGHNQAASGDGEITLAGALVRTLVVRAREDLEIAGQVRSVLFGEAGG
jgi:acetate kinase